MAWSCKRGKGLVRRGRRQEEGGEMGRKEELRLKVQGGSGKGLRKFEGSGGRRVTGGQEVGTGFRREVAGGGGE